MNKGMKEEEDGIQLFDAAEDDDDMKADDLPPSSNSTDED